MVIDHSHRLHKGITNSRPDKLHAPLGQCLAHRIGFRRSGWSWQMSLALTIPWRPTDKLPEKAVQAHELLLDLQSHLGIADRCGNFLPVSHNPGIGKQPGLVRWRHSRDRLQVESDKCPAVSLSFLEDG